MRKQKRDVKATKAGTTEEKEDMVRKKGVTVFLRDEKSIFVFFDTSLSKESGIVKHGGLIRYPQPNFSLVFISSGFMASFNLVYSVS